MEKESQTAQRKRVGSHVVGAEALFQVSVKGQPKVHSLHGWLEWPVWDAVKSLQGRCTAAAEASRVASVGGGVAEDEDLHVSN